MRGRAFRANSSATDRSCSISADASNKLLIGNDFIEFQARFAGVARELSVPVAQVTAIYSRENGAGMAFEIEGNAAAPAGEAPPSRSGGAGDDAPEPPRPEGGRPKLQRIK